MSLDDKATIDAAAPTPEDPDVGDVSIGDFFRRLYQITYSKVIGLIIILVFAVLVLVGVLVEQAPAGTYDTAEGQQAFLTSMQGRFGGWTTILDFLGFFRVFTSPLFLVVTVCLAISITGCTTHRIPKLWGNFRHPRTNVSARFFEAARYKADLATGLPDNRAITVATEQLKKRRYRVIPSGESGLFADKFSWSGFGTVTAHISFLVILAAFVVTWLWGFQQLLNVTVGGDPVAVGGNSGLTVQATTFDMPTDDTGRPLDYVSHLVLRQGDTVVAEQDVRVNSPLAYAGFQFHQTTYGLAVDVIAKNAQGGIEFQGAVPMDSQSDDGTISYGTFRLPARGVSIDVLTAASGQTNAQLPPGSAAFAVYRDGEDQPMGMNTVTQGQAATVGDLTLTFVRESQYTGITAKSDPGAILIWIGSALLVIGMTVTFTCRPRRVWLRADGGVLYLASSDKEDAGLRQHFNDLANAVPGWFDNGKEAS